MVEIWAVVRELESVLLVSLKETLMRLPGDLELLEDDRLEFSSSIIVSARLDVLEPEPESLEDVESLCSSFSSPHDTVKISKIIRKAFN